MRYSERGSDLRPVLPVASSRAKDGGWQMPCSCKGPGWRICQCYRPRIAGDKLCNASFSLIARLIRYTQENTCHKPSWRHCEMVFSLKNRLHHHLREECQKQLHRHRSSSPPPPLTPRIPSPAARQVAGDEAGDTKSRRAVRWRSEDSFRLASWSFLTCAFVRSYWLR